MRLLPLLLLLLTAAGCRAIEPAASPQAAAAAPDEQRSEAPAGGQAAAGGAEAEAAVASWTATEFQVGLSVEERPIHAVLLGADRQKPVVCMLAGMHGDEPGGTPLLNRLRRHLMEHPGLVEERAALLIPVANPDGYEEGSRFNANGVDLNRNFPSQNFEASQRRGPSPLSEPESQALFSLIHSIRPVCIVSIHMAAAVVDHDGPAEELARAMAALCALPPRRLGGRLGSFGSYFGQDLAIPVITLELTEADRKLGEDALWERYGEALLEAFRRPL